MAQVLFQVWSADRTKKKAFMALPTITDVIAKAHNFGLAGKFLLLESNRCEICEDEVLEIYANERKIFLLVSDCDDAPPGYETVADASYTFSVSEPKQVPVQAAAPQSIAKLSKACPESTVALPPMSKEEIMNMVVDIVSRKIGKYCETKCREAQKYIHAYCSDICDTIVDGANNALRKIVEWTHYILRKIEEMVLLTLKALTDVLEMIAAPVKYAIGF